MKMLNEKEVVYSTLISEQMFSKLKIYSKGKVYQSECCLHIQNFFRYKKNAKQAVDHLTFGVQKAECFGLLGRNPN